MSLLQNANKLFKEKRYKEAYIKYKEVENLYGRSFIEYNLKKCESYIFDDNIGINVVKKPTNSILNSYFDNIYVVNLQHKVADRLKVATHLKNNGIHFELFNAVNGYEGEALKKFEEYSLRKLGDFKRYPEFSERELKRGKPYIESAGAIGYIFTYLEILQDAQKKGYKRFLILEDDVLLDNDFECKFANFINNIDDDWKVLQLGASQYGWDSVNIDKAFKKGYYYPRRLDSCGSFAIAFDSSIIDELLESEKSFEAPFDHLPLGEIYERHLNKCFVSFPNIIIPDVSESTIRGGRSQVEHSKKMRWELEQFDFPINKPTMSIIIQDKINLKYFSSFSDGKDSPYVLNIFYNSVDGLRPLHNIEMLNKFDIVEIEGKLQLFQSDYVATIEKNKILSEKDIVNFIEYKAGIKQVNLSSLHEIDVMNGEYVKSRVSVIIPTYKRPTNLENALLSVVNQDYLNKEIIIVCDNGENSEYNEETKKIVNFVKSKHSDCQIKLIEHNLNRNGAAARNTGLLNSTGEYVCFLDDDDVYLSGRISKSIQKIKNTEKVIGAVYCGFLGWNSSDNDLSRYKSGDLTYEILSLDYKKHYLHTNTATYKRNALIYLNGFDESYKRHQDLELNLRFFENFKIDVVKEALVRLNPEPSNISNKVFNREMFDVKNKFLTQFKPLIFQYKNNKDIYQKHWNEVVKYSSNLEKLSLNFITDYTDGKMQILNSLIKKDIDTSVFPIGTCRIHEPLGLISEIGVEFPGAGYFHSSSQVVDWLRLLNDDITLNSELIKYFFRNDQTSENKFDLNLWNEKNYINALNEKMKLYKKSNILLIEICSLKTWKYKGISVQGNPNYFENIPYSEVWKDGYYKIYKKDMSVELITENKIDLEKNLQTINQYLQKNSQKAIITGHLVNPKEPHPSRLAHNQLLSNAINSLNSNNILYFDVNDCISTYGFQLDNIGSPDIHHLSNHAMNCQANKMSKLICSL